MSDQKPSRQRGTSKAITTMLYLLPLAEVAVEAIIEVQNAPTAVVAVGALLRTGILIGTWKRAG